MTTGLPSHPQYELAKRQCTGCPVMITFYIKGSLQHAETFLKNLKVASLQSHFSIHKTLRPSCSVMIFIISHFHPTHTD